MVTVEEVKKMKVAELKEELTKLGLPTDGLKKELMDRLEAAITAQDTPATAVSPATVTPAKQPTPQQPAPAAVAAAPAAPAAGTKALTEEEKRKIRAAKFGTTHLPEAEKKKLRAERFGSATNTGNAASAKSNNAQGAAKPVWKPAGVGKPADAPRFIPLSKAMSMEELERRKQRAAKFGTAPPTKEEEDAAKRLARAVKYGTLDEATKRAIRMQRFGGKEEGDAKTEKRGENAPPAKKRHVYGCAM